MQALIHPIRVESPVKSSEPEVLASKVQKPNQGGFGELLDLVGKDSTQASVQNGSSNNDRNSRESLSAQKEVLSDRKNSSSGKSRSNDRFEERDRLQDSRESSERKNVKKKEREEAGRSDKSEEADSEATLKDDTLETQALNQVALLTETLESVDVNTEQFSEEGTLTESFEWSEGESFASDSSDVHDLMSASQESGSESELTLGEADFEEIQNQDPRFENSASSLNEEAHSLSALDMEQQAKSQGLSHSNQVKTESSDSTFETREAPSLLETWTQDQTEGMGQEAEAQPHLQSQMELDEEIQAPSQFAQKMESSETSSSTKSATDRTVEPSTQVIEGAKEDKSLSELSKGSRASRPHSENIHLNSKGEALGKELGRVILQRLRGGEKHFRIFLTPPRLGQVQVDMDLQDGRLQLDMKVDSPAVRHLMNARIAELQESLASHGVQMDGFQVDVSDWGDQGPSSPFGDFDGQSRRGRSSDRSSSEANTQELEDDVLKESISYHDGLIDTRA